MFRVWKVSLEYLLGYIPEKKVPEFFWNSAIPVFIEAYSNENLVEKLGTNSLHGNP